MSNTIRDITQRIQTAHDTHQAIPFIRHDYDIDEETAYKIQDRWIQNQIQQNDEQIAGYKISMTSDDTQAIAGTDEPAYGTLLSSHLVKSGASIHQSSLFSPLIETEILFELTDDLNPQADTPEILQKAKIGAGIEIPDSRYIDWFPNFSLSDLLCDNAATGKVITSETKPAPSFEQLENITMDLYFNNEKTHEGDASAVLGNPAHAVAWLSKKLAQSGKTLKKGMIIASGTFIPPIPVEKGTYTAEYSNLGTVTITFE